MTIPFERLNPEVYVARDDLVVAGPEELDFLRRHVAETSRRRIRLCAHRDAGDPFQEMLILLSRETYIRPHAHPTKVESLHVIEGEADAVFFDEAGRVEEVLPLGAPASGRAFYYRLAVPRYHTLLLRSPHLLFHEATTGPFRREETRFASWAPAEGEAEAVGRYLADLEPEVRRLRRA